MIVAINFYTEQTIRCGCAKSMKSGVCRKCVESITIHILLFLVFTLTSARALGSDNAFFTCYFICTTATSVAALTAIVHVLLPKTNAQKHSARIFVLHKIQKCQPLAQVNKHFSYDVV